MSGVNRYYVNPSDALVSLATRPRPRYLDEEFLSGLSGAAVRDKSSRSMDWDETRYVVWRLTNGCTVTRAAAEIGRPYGVAQRMMRRLYRDASMFTMAGIVVRLDLGGQHKAHRWFCRICGYVSAHEGTADNHAWDHLWVEGGGMTGGRRAD